MIQQISELNLNNGSALLGLVSRALKSPTAWGLKIQPWCYVSQDTAVMELREFWQTVLGHPDDSIARSL